MSDFEPEIYDVFRGATKPTMLFGVPMIALVMAAFPFAIVAMWVLMIWGFMAFFISLSPFILVYLMMLDQTKQDDQQLKMFGMNIKEKLLIRQNRLPALHYKNAQTIFIVPPKPMRSTKFMEY